MTTYLTKRQRELLNFIEAEVAGRGIPPTVREIGRRFGISSPNGVLCHLKTLEEKGYLKKEPGVSRGIKLVTGISAAGECVNNTYPLIGEVAAGLPALAVQSEGESLTLDEAAGARPGDFLLKVKGDSMAGAGINPGDLAVVRPVQELINGEIAVVMVGEEEATVKRYHKEKYGLIRLVPENPAYQPALIDPKKTSVTIVGKVVGVVRRY